MLKGLVLLIVSLFISITYAVDKQPVICENTYALCNAAQCDTIPDQPDKVLCHCSVWTGKNAGYSACADRSVKKDADGNIKLVSTFSFGGEHYQSMTCPGNIAWATCLDQPCLRDAKEPRKADCTCKVVKSPNAFVTFAGECDAKRCSEQIWSGASTDGNTTLIKALAKAMGNVDLAATVCPR